MDRSESGQRSLIERIRSSDRAAFAEVYNYYFPSVYLFSYRFLKSREMAQECAQLAFIKVWEKRESLDVDLNFKSYLFTICKNLTLKTIERVARNNKFKEIMLAELKYSKSDDGSALEDLQKIANQAIEQLPSQRRKVFKLCKVEGKSYEETAAALGVSKGTVRDHIFKAGLAIREFLVNRKE